MRHTQPRELRFYRTSTGRVPFAEWYDSIQNLTLQGRIDKRLERMANGNFGDCRSVGAGVFELRFRFGPGHRIYFGEVESTIVPSPLWRRQIVAGKRYRTCKGLLVTIQGDTTMEKLTTWARISD